MGRLSQEDQALLNDLLRENGIDKLREFISCTFTPTVIKIRRITPEKAPEWIDLEAFAAWIVNDCQQRLRGSPPSDDPEPPQGRQVPTETGSNERTGQQPSPPPSQRRPSHARRGLGTGRGGERSRADEGDEAYRTSAQIRREPERTKRRRETVSASEDSESETDTEREERPRAAPASKHQSRSRSSGKTCVNCRNRGVPCVPRKLTSRHAAVCQRCYDGKTKCSLVEYHRQKK